MPLAHVPAHTENHPDRFIHEDSGLGYSVMPDLNAEDPRSWVESEHAALWAYNQPRNSDSVAGDKPDNVAVKAFAHYYDKTNDKVALALTRRYLAVFHTDRKITADTITIRGYAQRDWLDVFVATAEGYGTTAAHAEQFRMWAYGDVWTVIPDTKAGVCGIYADSAADALKQFHDEYEDRPLWESDATEVVGAEGTASNLVTAEALIEQARLLQSDSGDNAGYDRALVELVGNVLGHSQLLADNRSAAEILVLGRTIPSTNINRRAEKRNP